MYGKHVWMDIQGGFPVTYAGLHHRESVISLEHTPSCVLVSSLTFVMERRSKAIAKTELYLIQNDQASLET